MDQLQQYINQLLADLKAVQSADTHIAPADELSGVEAFLSNNYYSMKGLAGIEGVRFPPAKRLTTAQQQALIDGILELWSSLHIGADFPSIAPTHLLYKELTKAWAEEQFPLLGQGNFVLEFCNYIPTECPWGKEACSCKELFADVAGEDETFVVQQRLKKGYENLINDLEDLDDFDNQSENTEDKDR